MANDTLAPVETGLPAQDFEQGVENQEPESNPNATTVSVSALFGAKPADGSTEKNATPEKGKQDAPGAAQKPKVGERTFTQSEFNRILSERLNEERQKPAYQYGQAAISARAKRDGVSESEAAARLRTEENARTAKEYAENPEKAYNDMLNGTFNPYAQQEQPKPAPSPQAQYRYTPENVASSLESLSAGGTLPPGFSQESVTESFVIDAMQNGTEAALYRWMMANQNTVPARDTVAAELDRRKQLPRPMQSGGGNLANRPLSINSMSKEDFAKLDAEIAKGNRSGMSVRIQE